MHDWLGGGLGFNTAPVRILPNEAVNEIVDELARLNTIKAGESNNIRFKPDAEHDAVFPVIRSRHAAISIG